MSKIDYEKFYEEVYLKFMRCDSSSSGEVYTFGLHVIEFLKQPPMKEKEVAPTINLEELSPVEKTLFDAYLAVYTAERVPALVAFNRASRQVLQFRRDLQKPAAIDEDVKMLFSSLSVAR